MPYRDRIQRWVVVRLLPNFQHQDLARFHKCSDAEGYCQVLRRLEPNGRFAVMFDPGEPLHSS
ncbi:MAG: hypothetical protein HC772_15370 [Leptolyngbyaceae cyanobacterium CRU_2_3]|nr:hypothetical protein [Leptolyngbyaceae cyanobacterium CRU_2_3]